MAAVPRPLAALLLILAPLLVCWSLAVPVFEAPDEPAHWQYVLHVHDTGRLPVFYLHALEALQPPLYYVLTAPFAAPSDTPDMIGAPDAHGTIRSPAPPKFFRNGPGDLSRYWPIRRLRLVTAVLGLLTVVVVYATGVMATGRASTGLLAAGLTAFLPQFTFRSTNVSNDPLVTLLGALTLYLIVRLLRRGVHRSLTVLAALTMGVALLAKTNAIVLVVPFTLAVLSAPGARLRELGVLVLTGLLVTPWLVRNRLQYGEFFPTQVVYTVAPFAVTEQSITSPYFLTDFPALLARSFVGVFGWMNVWLPERLYRGFFALALLAVLGHVMLALRGRWDRRLVLVVATAPLLALVATVHYNLTYSQPQGRYLFPALSALSLLTAIGLEGLPGWRPAVSAALVGLLALVNVYTLAAVVVPAYWSFPAVVQDVATSSIGPLSPTLGLGQTFVAPCDGLDRVDVFVQADEGGPGRVEAAVFRDGDPTPVTRGELVVTQAALCVAFAPQADSRDRMYRIELRGPETSGAGRVSVQLASQDTLPGGTALVNGRPFRGDLAFRAFCHRDWGLALLGRVLGQLLGRAAS